MKNKLALHFLLYLIPAIMDCISGIFYFIGPVRAALLGYDVLVAGSLVAARSVCNCVAGVLISRFLTSRNAVKFMYIGTTALVGICLLGLWANNLTMLYITSGLSGFGQVIFVTSFQVFMTIADSGQARRLSRVVGTYTAAWCTGMAFGPFITGFLMELGKPADGIGLSVGWKYTYVVAALLVLIVIISITIIVKTTPSLKHGQARPSAVIRPQPARPNFAWVGWIMAVSGVMVLGMVRGVFPAGVTDAGLPEIKSGTMMMMLGLAMGWFAYLLARGRNWMYSGKTMMLVGMIGVAGLALFALPYFADWGIIQHTWQYYLGSVVLGSYFGVVYLYSTFHSLANPSKSGRNISINETFLAVGMMLGPLVGGWLVRHYGFYMPFTCAMAVLFTIGIFQWIVSAWYNVPKNFSSRRFVAEKE